MDVIEQRVVLLHHSPSLSGVCEVFLVFNVTCSLQILLLFPSLSQKHADKQTGCVKFVMNENVCVRMCVCIRRAPQWTGIYCDFQFA